jgi:hypothetical protein
MKSVKKLLTSIEQVEEQLLAEKRKLQAHRQYFDDVSKKSNMPLLLLIPVAILGWQFYKIIRHSKFILKPMSKFLIRSAPALLPLIKTTYAGRTIKVRHQKTIPHN